MTREPRDPNEVGIEYPNGRKLRTSADYPPPRMARPRVGGVALATALAVGIVLGAVALGAGYWLRGPSPTVTPPEGNEVSFTLTEFITGFVGSGGAIDGVTNPTLRVNRSDQVTITVTNGQSFEHDFFIEGYLKHITGLTSINARGSVTFVADREGTFAYYCTIPGHRASMEGQFIVGTSEPGPEPARPVQVSNIAKNATHLPPPLNRTTPTIVDLYLEAHEVVAEIESGTTFTYWTFNETVPGPFFRVLVNDTVFVHFRNNAESKQPHSVDFHAVTGPGGGKAASEAVPGEETDFTFKAITPGLFVYHCASDHIPSHIAMGMYGLILVEPDGGLPAMADGRPIREFYVVQGDLYTKWAAGTQGHQEHDEAKLLEEDPSYVVFNGKWRALTGTGKLNASVNDTVRIFFGVGGPNLISSFHVIGEMFDRVYSLGDVLSPPQQMVQTILVPPGGAAIVDFKLEVPGDYLLVDHALSRAIDKGALGILTVTGPPNPSIFNP